MSPIVSVIAGAEQLIDERIAYARRYGLSPRVGSPYREPAAPWRLVWHTIEAPEDDPGTAPDEGWTLAQVRDAAIRHRTPPHLWAAPLHDWVGQTVPLDLAAYALARDSGDPETNHMHAVQVEVLGLAANGLDDDDTADWLGVNVVRPILQAGVPIDVSVIAPSTGSDGYGERGAVRMTWAEWRAFRGICGHANVPGNEHWDPGLAAYARMARAAVGGITVTTPSKEDSVFYVIVTDSHGEVGYGGPGYWHHLDRKEADAVQRRLGDPDPITLGEFYLLRAACLHGERCANDAKS